MRYYPQSIVCLIIMSATATPMTSAGAFTGSFSPVAVGEPHQEKFMRVDEKVLNLPRDPSIAPRPKMTEELVQKTMDADLKARFDSAAAHSNNMLTAQQARDANWGFLADHFDEIDRNRDGYVSFDEVAAYMAARSPLRKRMSRPLSRLSSNPQLQPPISLARVSA
ncbi:hypothetical protein HB779_06665 [Phyllobacterium sp. 628]|uniref:EF-hand domain-containing protein n=1 Tax=Phyllobacterium sp. 628 TaxID=2718938 RepID=UPI001662371D|nr:EF-hand domain-containing protein [Phyllobacterium sp. 628]QND51616.1 hypothetical protein HB779_06665 [Phyllobacterium sp. 628]